MTETYPEWREAQYKRDLAELLKSPVFRRAAVKFMDALNLRETTWRYGSRPHDIAFSLGLKESATLLYRDLRDADPALLQKAFDEQTQEENQWSAMTKSQTR